MRHKPRKQRGLVALAGQIKNIIMPNSGDFNTVASCRSSSGNNATSPSASKSMIYLVAQVIRSAAQQPGALQRPQEQLVIAIPFAQQDHHIARLHHLAGRQAPRPHPARDARSRLMRRLRRRILRYNNRRRGKSRQGRSVRRHPRYRPDLDKTPAFGRATCAPESQADGADR